MDNTPKQSLKKKKKDTKKDVGGMNGLERVAAIPQLSAGWR